ncbi:hypothetical protein AVEN_117243-1 [Araneus ventricosus]|uniref:Uncharacterized protein n=1 Tax=Araneus ventricosus TaxID=182803 RepID=A0A4Y2AZ88_ARAVE|nr:hypothetical protein AVEN_117243-1 [Araneus ventricosus]
MRTSFRTAGVKCSKGVPRTDIRSQNDRDVRSKKEHLRETLLLYLIVKTLHLNVTAYCGNMHHRRACVNAGLNGLGNSYGKKRIFGIRRMWCIMSFGNQAKQ